MTENVNRDDEVRDMWDDDNPDGAELLDQVAAWFIRFISFTDPRDASMLALWAAHTHMAEELYTTPRLQVDSITYESGKTTVLDHLNRLCLNPLLAATISSPALIPRLIDQGRATILLDEIDRSLAADKPGVPELLGVLNSGYRFGSSRPVLVPMKGGGWEPQNMSTFAPVAMAGNNPNLPDDVKSRSIRLLLLPDLNGSIEESDWEEIDADVDKLRNRLVAWSTTARQSVKGLKVTLPSGCTNRSREKWRPLKRVAVVAGGNWPAIVDDLIERDMAEAAALRESGLSHRPPGMILLNDLAEVWTPGEPFMPTRDLVSMLVAYNPGYWGDRGPYGKELTDVRFSRLLAQSSKVTSIRPGGVGHRGFALVDLRPVWQRLGIKLTDPDTPPFQPGEPGEPGERGGGDQPGSPSQPAPPGSKGGVSGGGDRFAWPPCFYCDKPVTSGQTDEAGRHSHLSCRNEGGAR